MKVYFLFFSICLFCSSFLISKPYNKSYTEGMTIHKDSISTDTVPNYFITTNGRSNSVQITSDKSKSANTRQEKRNKIEVNGDQNSVSITENGAAGTIQISQNGNQNKVNITQTNEKSKK